MRLSTPKLSLHLSLLNSHILLLISTWKFTQLAHRAHLCYFNKYTRYNQPAQSARHSPEAFHTWRGACVGKAKRRRISRHRKMERTRAGQCRAGLWLSALKAPRESRELSGALRAQLSRKTPLTKISMIDGPVGDTRCNWNVTRELGELLVLRFFFIGHTCSWFQFTDVNC